MPAGGFVVVINLARLQVKIWTRLHNKVTVVERSFANIQIIILVDSQVSVKDITVGFVV